MYFTAESFDWFFVEFQKTAGSIPVSFIRIDGALGQKDFIFFDQDGGSSWFGIQPENEFAGRTFELLGSMD